MNDSNALGRSVHAMTAEDLRTNCEEREKRKYRSSTVLGLRHHVKLLSTKGEINVDEKEGADGNDSVRSEKPTRTPEMRKTSKGEEEEEATLSTQTQQLHETNLYLCPPNEDTVVDHDDDNDDDDDDDDDDLPQASIEKLGKGTVEKSEKKRKKIGKKEKRGEMPVRVIDEGCYKWPLQAPDTLQEASSPSPLRRPSLSLSATPALNSTCPRQRDLGKQGYAMELDVGSARNARKVRSDERGNDESSESEEATTESEDEGEEDDDDSEESDWGSHNADSDSASSDDYETYTNDGKRGFNDEDEDDSSNDDDDDDNDDVDEEEKSMRKKKKLKLMAKKRQGKGSSGSSKVSSFNYPTDEYGHKLDNWIDRFQNSINIIHEYQALPEMPLSRLVQVHTTLYKHRKKKEKCSSLSFSVH